MEVGNDKNNAHVFQADEIIVTQILSGYREREVVLLSLSLMKELSHVFFSMCIFRYVYKGGIWQKMCSEIPHF